MKVDNANGKEVGRSTKVTKSSATCHHIQVMRLLQYLTMVLMSLYGHRDLVKRASSAVKHDNFQPSISSSLLFQVLHDLVNVIVLILLEPGVAELPEGSQLVRALNVLTVKVVDR